MRDVEVHGHSPSGGEPATWLLSAVPLRDAADETVGLTVTIVEITQRKHREQALEVLAKEKAAPRDSRINKKQAADPCSDEQVENNEMSCGQGNPRLGSAAGRIEACRFPLDGWRNFPCGHHSIKSTDTSDILFKCATALLRAAC